MICRGELPPPAPLVAAQRAIAELAADNPIYRAATGAVMTQLLAESDTDQYMLDRLAGIERQIATLASALSASEHTSVGLRRGFGDVANRTCMFTMDEGKSVAVLGHRFRNLSVMAEVNSKANGKEIIRTVFDRPLTFEDASA